MKARVLALIGALLVAPPVLRARMHRLGRGGRIACRKSPFEFEVELQLALAPLDRALDDGLGLGFLVRHPRSPDS